VNENIGVGQFGQPAVFAVRVGEECEHGQVDCFASACFRGKNKKLRIVETIFSFLSLSFLVHQARTIYQLRL
jgi:hypothetical protein